MPTQRPVAIITGAANNIGLACARRFASTHTLVLADLVDASAHAKNFPQARAVCTDVSDFASCQNVVSEAQKIGSVEVLIHSAGITKPACSILDMPVEEWKQVININLTGTFLIAKACIPAMLATGKGSMALFSSRAGKTGFAALGANANKTKAHYCASKAGVISLIKSLATELAQYNIRVNGIAPGPVKASMIPESQWASIAERVPLHRLGTPDEMAEAAWFVCSDQAAFITGHTLDVNGGTLMD